MFKYFMSNDIQLKDLLQSSDLFDEEWYKTEYEDVSFLDMHPLDHYIEVGSLLLRNPSPKFNSKLYIERYPEVAEANIEPLAHFLLYGKREGRVLPAQQHDEFQKIAEPSHLLINQEVGNDIPNVDNTCNSNTDSAQLKEGLIQLYEFLLGRGPAESEQNMWLEKLNEGLSFLDIFQGIAGSREAINFREASFILKHLSDGQYIQFIYEIVLNRGSRPDEIEARRRQLYTKQTNRTKLIIDIVKNSIDQKTIEEQAEQVTQNNPLSSSILGTSSKLTLDDWARRSEEVKINNEVYEPSYKTRFNIKKKPQVLVSALTSLYKGGDYIDAFMQNMVEQSCFKDYAELIIVDADSPENESETIERYCREYKNIKYLKMNYRIGIYDAWNVAAKAATGAYLTNTNLDDLRRNDSFELQASVLENLEFVDVVYQDFYYSFDPNLSFDEIATFRFKSELSVVTPINMMIHNAPHNAPMWRKSLHEELGYFDTSYKSAGDYEFWMRCLTADKQFFKLNDPHVVYYVNPEGLSTRADTRGLEESCRITTQYNRQLISNNVVKPLQEFCQDIGLKYRKGFHLKRSRYELVQSALNKLAERKFHHE